eukprot:5172404-Pleurochrysis_carterae.AAC.1
MHSALPAWVVDKQLTNDVLKLMRTFLAISRPSALLAPRIMVSRCEQGGARRSTATKFEGQSLLISIFFNS